MMFYVVLHELAGCMLAFVLCLIMHDMHVHFQRVSIATCCHHVGFCGTTGHAGLGFCPVEAPSRATERKVSFSQETSFVHHMCSQSQNFIRLALVVKLFAGGTDNFNLCHVVSFPFVAWRRVVKIQKGRGQ